MSRLNSTGIEGSPVVGSPEIASSAGAVQDHGLSPAMSFTIGPGSQYKRRCRAEEPRAVEKRPIAGRARIPGSLVPGIADDARTGSFSMASARTQRLSQPMSTPSNSTAPRLQD